ncbi:hypothetical protein PAM7971_00300 [Pacificibacter marinus]|uniref:Uncharacterized protein n=1 Tax=Pacificibacter marinus TaxID=658057 RepID=A0A1Y5REQ2_9RHOB|nr:hypothetical protein PAM7971_00300 [Pacificibacter marinus]
MTIQETTDLQVKPVDKIAILGLVAWQRVVLKG